MSSIAVFFRNTHFFSGKGFAVSAILSLVLLTQVAQPASAQTSGTLTSPTEVVIPLERTPTPLPAPTAIPPTPFLTNTVTDGAPKVDTAKKPNETNEPEESKGILDKVVTIFRETFSSKQDYLRWIGWGTGGFVVLLLIWYVLRVMKSFRRDRGYLASHTDEQPSVDERLLSELAPMEVALLRGSIDGYYEKVFYLSRQLLRSRNLLEDMDLSMEDIIVHLHTMGVDPAFLDCVESIFERCTAVCARDERPNNKAHYKLREDLTTLIHMNPFSVAVGRKRDKKIEKPKEDLLNSPSLSDDDE